MDSKTNGQSPTTHCSPSARTVKKHIKRLRVFGDAYADMERAIVTQTTRQIKKVISATESMDTGNCWWAIYQVSPIVRKIAEGELKRRSHLKRSRRAKS